MKNRKTSVLARAIETSQSHTANGSHEPDRQQQISEAAYFRAQQRGFAPGQELEDWVVAEMQIRNGAGLGA